MFHYRVNAWRFLYLPIILVFLSLSSFEANADFFGAITPDVTKDQDGASVQKLANDAESFMSKMIDTFRTETSAMASTAKTVALAIVGTLVFFAIFLKAVESVFRDGDTSSITSDLVWFILKVGFWTMLIMGTVVSLYMIPEWLYKAGMYIAHGSMPGAISPPNMPDVISTAWDAVWNSTPKGFLTGVLAFMAMGLVIAGIFYLYYNFLFAILESLIIAISSVVVLGFGVFDHSRDYAMKQIHYAVGLGIKLLTLSIVMAVYPVLIQSIINGMSNTGATVSSLLIFVMMVLVLLGFTIGLPKIVQSAMSGSVSDSSGSLSSALKVGAGAAVVGAAAGVGSAIAANKLSGGTLGEMAMSAGSALGGVGSKTTGAMGSAFSGAAGALGSSKAGQAMGSAFSGAIGLGVPTASNPMANLASGAKPGSAAASLGGAGLTTAMGGSMPSTASQGVDTSAGSSKFTLGDKADSDIGGYSAKIDERSSANNFLPSSNSSANAAQSSLGAVTSANSTSSLPSGGTSLGGLGGSGDKKSSLAQALAGNANLGTTNNEEAIKPFEFRQKTPEEISQSANKQNESIKPGFSSKLFAMGTTMLADGLKGSAGLSPHSSTASKLVNMVTKGSIDSQQKSSKSAYDSYVGFGNPTADYQKQQSQAKSYNKNTL